MSFRGVDDAYRIHEERTTVHLVVMRAGGVRKKRRGLAIQQCRAAPAGAGHAPPDGVG